MSASESVSRWISGLQSGRQSAATHLFNRYYRRLRRLAKRKLPRAARRVADEEDIATSALESFFRRAQRGDFPELHNRNELWRLLITITLRKVENQLRDRCRLKRGGGRMEDEAAWTAHDSSSASHALEQLVSSERSPEFRAIMKESLLQMLNALDPDLRQIAQYKLDNFTNAEIAARVRRSLPTVERRLRLIRAAWTEQGKLPS